MKKAIAILLSTILALALLIYSGLRSLDFIQSTLPPDKQVLSYFAIAATEGGLVLWLLYFLYGAAGMWQRGVSLLMIVVDLLGSVALFTADTLLRAGQTGMVSQLDQTTMQTVILAMSGVIALNVCATVFCHITDPTNMKTQAVEEANDRIESLALDQIKRGSEGLAAELAPLIAEDWMQQARARYTAALGSGATLGIASQTLDGKAKDAQPKRRLSKIGAIFTAGNMRRKNGNHQAEERIYPAEAEEAFLANQPQGPKQEGQK